jgi:predicted Rossmann-fold nucleotide-binding protein
MPKGPAARPHLLISGSRKLPGKKRLAKFVRALARGVVMNTDWRLITGGYGVLAEPVSVDALVVTGADEALGEKDDLARERVLTMVPGKSTAGKYFKFGLTMVVADSAPRQRRAEMVQRADMLVAISGGKGTADILDQAYAADKPLLPLAFTGGAAAEAWKRYRPLLTKRYALTSDEIELIEKGDKPSAAAERLIPILARMTKPRETAMVPGASARPPSKSKSKSKPAPPQRTRALDLTSIARTDGKLRLVIASPGDVAKERAIVRKVVAEVNRGVAADRGIEVQAVMWETDTYPGFHPAGPQGVVDELLKIEHCDVLVGIFWKRFGTPTTTAASGTEHEIRTATAAWELHRKPHVMLYFSTRPYSPKNASETKQWTQVLEFRAEFETKGLLGSYPTQKRFEEIFRDHLTLHMRSKYALPRAPK